VGQAHLNLLAGFAVPDTEGLVLCSCYDCIASIVESNACDVPWEIG